MKKIIFISPKYIESKKLRVAVYCRVNTLGMVQKYSFD